MIDHLKKMLTYTENGNYSKVWTYPISLFCTVSVTDQVNKNFLFGTGGREGCKGQPRAKVLSKGQL
jgi:hypothetical protein